MKKVYIELESTDQQEQAMLWKPFIAWSFPLSSVTRGAGSLKENDKEDMLY